MTEPAKALVLSEFCTASTDYFVFPYLQHLGYRACWVGGKGLDKALLSDCRLLVIARYVSTGQLDLLAACRHEGLRIVYFMDDDLFDAQALVGLPWPYQWKIFSKALVHRRRLTRLCDAFWFSSPYLAEKYPSLRPVVLSPIAITPPLANSATSIIVCYHGTASHQQELAWLLPIIAAVQAQSDTIHFELFGTGKVARAVKQLPRVSVLQPMSWTNYLAYTSIQRRTIGLAPLLLGKFNSARAATKFFDYARMGAVGIYTDTPPYRGFISNGCNGCLLANDPALWVDKILQLASAPGHVKILQAGVQAQLVKAVFDNQG